MATKPSFNKLSPNDITALVLSFKLASITVLVLLIISIPLAYWITYSQSRLTKLVNTLVTMPLVLPPTVLGFYLLLFMNSQSSIGSIYQKITGNQLIFSFTGLVIASIIYSLPFVVQPIAQSFTEISKQTRFTANSIANNKFEVLRKILLPLSKKGIIIGSVFGFVHTLGEFGVVLMIGGNIPEETRVASIQIFNHVENFRFQEAHMVSLLLISISFLVVLLINYNSKIRVIN